MPTLKVTRDTGYVDWIRKYRVFVDGSEVGRVGNGKSIEVKVKSGIREIEARIDWCGTNTIAVDVTDADVHVFLESSLRGEAIFSALYRILFDRNNYVKIRQM